MKDIILDTTMEWKKQNPYSEKEIINEIIETAQHWKINKQYEEML